MKKINYLFSAMGLLALAACSSDNDQEYGMDMSTARQIVPVTQINEMSTRADQGLQATAIAKDVKVRFVVTETGQTEISNQSLLTSDGSNGFSESTTNLYYPVSGSGDIYGYAPATSTEISALTGDIAFAVQTDQSSNDNYLASDLLVATKTTAEAPADGSTGTVKVTFKHMLTKLNLNISEDLKPANVNIANAKTNCTFDLQNATVTATGEAGSVVAATLAGTETATDGYYKFSAIVIPQSFSSEANMIEITTQDGDTYTFTPSAEMTLSGSTEYTYKVTATSSAKKVAMTLQSEVTDWTSGGDEQEAIVEKAERTAHVGDWYTAEGKYVDGTSECPSNTIGVVFNTADAPTGYQAYVTSLIDKANTNWGADVASTALGSEFVTTGAAAVATRNGLDLTSKVTNSYTAFNGILTSSTFTSTYLAPTEKSSGWFVPSIGEMILLANSIYGGTATGDESEAKVTVSGASAGYDNSTIQARIKAAQDKGLFTSASNTDFLNGGTTGGSSNPSYFTTTETDASTIYIMTLNETKAYTISTSAKATSSRRTHLILLAK